MPRSSWHYIAAIIGCLVIAVTIGLLLQPKEPKLLSDSGDQTIAASYRAGGASCEPSAIRKLRAWKRPRKEEACQEAQEQHQEAANSLIEARRGAYAADAQAVSAYKQTGIAAWGTGLGVITMFAAIAAAVYAREAARHTDRGANIAANNLSAFEKASQPSLAISLDSFFEQLSVVQFRVVATNVGSTGCVITAIGHQWCKPEEVPTVLSAHTTPIAIPVGESKQINTLHIPVHRLIIEPEIEGLYRFEGPFLAEPELGRFRFWVFPEVSYPHMTWYSPRPVLAGRKRSES